MAPAGHVERLAGPSSWLSRGVCSECWSLASGLSVRGVCFMFLKPLFFLFYVLLIRGTGWGRVRNWRRQKMLGGFKWQGGGGALERREGMGEEGETKDIKECQVDSSDRVAGGI